jgi:hypothetical protein
VAVLLSTLTREKIDLHTLVKDQFPARLNKPVVSTDSKAVGGTHPHIIHSGRRHLPTKRLRRHEHSDVHLSPTEISRECGFQWRHPPYMRVHDRRSRGGREPEFASSIAGRGLESAMSPMWLVLPRRSARLVATGHVYSCSIETCLCPPEQFRQPAIPASYMG